MTEPAAKPSVLIVDAGHGIGPRLANLLAAQGFEVVAWAPGHDATPAQATECVSWVREPSIDALDAELIASAGAVIFNTCGLDEAALLAEGRLAEAVAADADFFMRTLQAISRTMMTVGHGQIWVLAADDSFAYYLPLPVAPISHHTRIGAMRALAKELARFGVAANAAVLQPDPETAEPAAWQRARPGLGSYAQKFKPVPLEPIAETLAFWAGRERLPMNGSVLHFGTGIYDGNL